MSADVLVPLPVLLPLLGATLALLVHRHRTLQRAVSVLVCGANLGVAVLLVRLVLRDGTQAVDAGNWEAPIGITLVADRFGAAMVLVAAVIVFAVLVYALGQLAEEVERLYFHPVYLVLAAGVSLAFVTGDLFNLFVSFEVLLIASYVLLTLGGRADQVRSGTTYVVINLVASTLFVTAVAFVYGATGTVNLAELALRMPDLPEHLRTGLGMLLLVVFGIKAGLFPLFFWLPDSYPTAPAPITALFAGLLTKVGVYAIVRTQTLLFQHEGPSPGLLFIAGATMLIGVLGAVAQGEIKRILSFHIISQIGYMVLGLGLYSIAGLAGAILYILHHIIVKTTLFCVEGTVAHGFGTGRIAEIAGVARRAPVLAVLFLLSALSLAGVPPLSGFVAKLSLAQAGLAQGRYVVITVALLVSLLTLFSMTKIWAGAFWGAPSEAAADSGGRLPVPAPMIWATGGLVAVSLGIAVLAEPLYTFTYAAATELLDPAVYVDAVMSR